MKFIHSDQNGPRIKHKMFVVLKTHLNLFTNSFKYLIFYSNAQILLDQFYKSDFRLYCRF